MMRFYSDKRKGNTFGRPPPQKKQTNKQTKKPKQAQGFERSRYGYTHKCLFIPAACDLDFY